MTKHKLEGTMQLTSIDYDKDSHQWDITLTGSGWPWMMKISKARCPRCNSTNVHKDGSYLKGGKRYECQNKSCKHYFIIKDNPAFSRINII